MSERDKIHPLQAMMNGWSQNWQKQRAETQMTLGKLIAELEKLPPETPVFGLGKLMSYRGYYCDLAFSPTGEQRSVKSLLDECREAMGKVFTGYKGGDYVMGETTPLWLAAYGECGERIMGLSEKDGAFRIDTSPDDSL